VEPEHSARLIVTPCWGAARHSFPDRALSQPAARHSIDQPRLVPPARRRRSDRRSDWPWRGRDGARRMTHTTAFSPYRPPAARRPAGPSRRVTNRGSEEPPHGVTEGRKIGPCRPRSGDSRDL
jgi:hypothetical protein